MASIAHVISASTVEFHRLHSHRQIVFWRFSTKQFSDFGENDLLFFLCNTKRKEKGIVGFGQLKRIQNLKTKYLYSKYDKQLGENSAEEFIKLVDKTNKAEDFPEILNCLFLENVTYFKSPVYLSKYGFELSKQVESFVYIDIENNITSQILLNAARNGLDFWSETQDPLKHQLKGLATCYEASRLIQMSELFKNRERHRFKLEIGEPLMNTSVVRYSIKENKVTLTFPIYTQQKKEHYSVLGLLNYLEANLKETIILQVEFYNEPNFESPLLNYRKERINLESA